MTYEELKKIAEVLHTIYCQKEHEKDMMLFEKTPRCTHYLENSIDRTWELKAHKEWLAQAQLMITMSEPLAISEVLQDIVRIYQIAEQLKKVNPKLLEYIKILIS